MENEVLPRPRRVSFWFFFLILPTSVTAATLALYVHEFAHGLAALALGGHFIGIKSDYFRGPSRVLAFADAWSDRGHSLVLLAGIAVNVAVGAVLLRKAFRTAPVWPRLLLLMAASAFLSDLGYAFEGCLHWRQGDFDTAYVLQDLDSEGLRDLSLAVLFPAMAAAATLLGRGLFRAWEDILGPLGAWRAFWVIVVLVSPVPWPSLRGADGRIGWAVALVLFTAITVHLIRKRRRDVEPAPLGRPWRWIGFCWLSLLPAVAGLVVLHRGLRFGTFPDLLLFEVRAPDRTAAGLRARYGMGDRYGNDRPVFQPQLFVSAPDGIHTAEAPEPRLVDLSWVPSRRVFLAVGRRGLYEVSPAGGESRSLWQTDGDEIRAGAHGPQGEFLLAIDRPFWTSAPLKPVLYAYNAGTGRGRRFDSEQAVGNPYFLPGLPVRARVGVGRELWQFTWGVDDEDGFRLDVLDEESEEGWYEGSSGERHWWSDEHGWRSGEVRVAREGVESWAIGAAGLYTIHRNGEWRLTPPTGEARREGRLDASALLSLHVDDGAAWIAFKDGDVRRLEEPLPSFRIFLPDPDPSR